MRLNSATYNFFSSSFVTTYTVVFTEYLRLCKNTSSRSIAGKTNNPEEKRSQKLLTVLLALDSDNLTDKEIEALEYCLRQLNHSLSVPTVSPLVNVSEEAPEPVEYTMNAYAGLFALTGQDVAFTLGANESLTADVGSFALNGQDVTFTHGEHETFAAESGSFALGGQAVTFTFTPAPYIIVLELAETVAGDPVWRAEFESASPADTDTCEVTGTGDTDTRALASGDDVVVTVYKFSNSGIAEDAGTVSWFVNGVLNGAPAAFANLDNLDGTGVNYKQRTLTGLVKGDTLKVEVNEG